MEPGEPRPKHRPDFARPRLVAEMDRFAARRGGRVYDVLSPAVSKTNRRRADFADSKGEKANPRTRPRQRGALTSWWSDARRSRLIFSRFRRLDRVSPSRRLLCAVFFERDVQNLVDVFDWNEFDLLFRFLGNIDKIFLVQ